MSDYTSIWLFGPSHAERMAEHAAHDAYLRSCASCLHVECRSRHVEEALFMCMFWIWVDEFGAGWEGAIE